MRNRRLGTLLGFPALVLALAAAGFASSTDKVVEVTIGPVGATVHDLVEEHNISIRSLERGKTDYWVRSPDRRRYDVTLTTENIEEILGETTVMAEAMGGPREMMVSITVKEERRRGIGSPRESGW